MRTVQVPLRGSFSFLMGKRMPLKLAVVLAAKQVPFILALLQHLDPRAGQEIRQHLLFQVKSDI